MVSNPVAKRRFEISGTGNQVKVFLFHGKFVIPAALPAGGAWDPTGRGSSHNGILNWINVRQLATGGATAFDYRVVDGNYDLQTVISGAAAFNTIPGDYIAQQAAAVALTAGTASSLDAAIADKTYDESLALVVNVSAVGAWTLQGYLATRH